ncbi:hypothetical protein ACFPH6_12450 [Streptomyces xiangluensis]|uniref:Secreted protein n=1 Tax=Streptomyces xiangluensis TaxID=2665720 RepID=A0ABV8YM74_9ACTN
MDWAAPISAVIGGSIAVGATLVADRVRWRREGSERERERRRVLYADFLGAVNQAREQLWYASRWEPRSGEERVRLAQSALRDHDVYPKRFQLALSSSSAVDERCQAVLDVLIAYRDAVVGGANHDDQAAEDQRLAFQQERRQLIAAMREDVDGTR